MIDTVADLIRELQKCNPTSKVRIVEYIEHQISDATTDFEIEHKNLVWVNEFEGKVFLKTERN